MEIELNHKSTSGRD